MYIYVTGPSWKTNYARTLINNPFEPELFWKKLQFLITFRNMVIAAKLCIFTYKKVGIILKVMPYHTHLTHCDVIILSW